MMDDDPKTCETCGKSIRSWMLDHITDKAYCLPTEGDCWLMWDLQGVSGHNAIRRYLDDTQ